MIKIALTLALVSGLYLGKSHAEGVGSNNTKPDSSKISQTEMSSLDEVALEVSEVAEDLMNTSPQVKKDEQTSTSFLMQLTSINAAKAAEYIRATIEK